MNRLRESECLSGGASLPRESKRLGFCGNFEDIDVDFARFQDLRQVA
jgi:hypothetical protein